MKAVAANSGRRHNPAPPVRRNSAPSGPAVASPLLDITDVAERLGVSVRHVRRLVNERRIPYLKWGHLLRFDPVEIEQWLDQTRRPALQ